MHSDTKTATTTNETRDLAMRVIHAFQALDVLEWALHSRLDDGDGNHLEAFTRPVIEARDLLTLFYQAFLTNPEEYEKIARGEAVVKALPKEECLAAHARATKKASEVMPTAPIDIGIFDLENDRDDLVKAMGQLTAAKHDIMGAFSEGNALDEVFRLLANVKAGIENAHGALVDAGVVEAKGGA